MASSTFYPAYDGRARWYDGIETSWATVRGKTTATDTTDSSNPDAVCYSSQNVGPGALIIRGFYSFDTSALPDSAVITAATLSFYGTSVVGTVGAVCVQESTMASNTALVAADFDNFNATELASRINITSWSTSGYNDFALNSSGLALISKTGYTKFCVRHSSDVDASAPASSAAAYASMSEHTGTSQDPKLVVTYSLGVTTSDSWAWSDSADITGKSGGTIRTYTRASVGDAWAWSDTAARPTPPARTAGTQRTVFSSGGTWHYQFPSMVKLSSGRQLCLARKSATGHAALDGVAVSKYSDDDGATWSSETVVTALQAGQDDYRGGNMQVLSGGRIGHTFFTADDSPVKNRGWYSYSDDNGASWSTPVQIDTAAWDEGAFVASDLVQLASGRIVVAGFGRPTYASTQWSAATVYSDDGGATWADLGTIAAYGTYSFNVVEPQIERFETGKLFATYHTEDSVPTNFYRTTSTDGGATWAAGTLVTGTSYNRQGISTINYDRGVVIAYSDEGHRYLYLEAANYGATFASAVEVAADPGGVESYITWAMPTQLAGVGDQQNIGFVYSWENSAQTLGSVYFKQFSGLDGTFIYPRTTSDAWAWSDSAARSAALPRTTSDSWAWGDSAGRGDRWAWTDSAVGLTAAYSSRTTSDTWAWADTVTGTATRSRTTTDTWAWTDAGALPIASYYSRTTTDTWAWTDSSGSLPVTIYWLRARRSSSMNSPTKTYSVVQAKGTTRTATWTSPTYKAETEAGILVVLDVTAASGTGGLTLRINAHDLAGSVAVPLNSAPTAVTGTGTTSYVLYPFGAVAGAVTQATSFYLPRQFSITVTHGDSSSYTYSVGFCLLP